MGPFLFMDTQRRIFTNKLIQRTTALLQLKQGRNTKMGGAPTPGEVKQMVPSGRLVAGGTHRQGFQSIDNEWVIEN